MTVALLLVLLTGCSKCIKTETKVVEVKIVGEYYGIEKILPRTYESVEEIRGTETYKIVVEYENRRYTISCEEKIYNKYKHKLGETAFALLEINTYENGQEGKIITLSNH